MYGERAMADAQKGSALGNLSYAHVANDTYFVSKEPPAARDFSFRGGLVPSDLGVRTTTRASTPCVYGT